MQNNTMSWTVYFPHRYILGSSVLYAAYTGALHIYSAVYCQRSDTSQTNEKGKLSMSY